VAERTRAHPSLRTAVIWAVLGAELDARAGASLQILDVGGGSGQFAVPLAALGHHVTVVDASPDALAALERRAAEQGVAERIRALQGDVDSLLDVIEPVSRDLVLCHSLLEVVDDPAIAIAAVVATLRPGGCLSVVVANRHAAVLSRALGGHLAEAARTFADPAGQTGPADVLQRRFDPATAVALLEGAGLRVESVHGVRVLADLVPGAVLEGEPGAAAALHDLELALSDRPPYRDIATQLHLLGRRG
jgi:S-adenosylmethionine-dependent methyltransferase